MKKTRWAAIACVLLLLAGGLYYFLREEALAPPPGKEPQSAPANIQFSGSSIIEQDNGKKLWELSAETLLVDPKGEKVQLINFKGTLYRENGTRIEVIARQANFDTKTKNITMEGDIKATSSDGAVFTAPLARWEAKDRMFYGTGGITLTREDTVLTGEQIETDADMEKTKVQGNARVVKGGTAR
ncbi:MAG TPA: LPS export ABC transporter periplasmic protein LptC [Selenomonadales bacterium]|nr:LPS export ABC transporter periplasmic protein LptC [Selenomonadales bacterium]